MQNIFNHTYEPVVDATNATGDDLMVLSDIIRFSDAFCILKVTYGDGTPKHSLEPDFGKKYPDIVQKYFRNTDELPDRIKKELGL